MHVVYNMHLVHTRVDQFFHCQLLRNDPDDFAAGIQNGVGDDTH